MNRVKFEYKNPYHQTVTFLESDSAIILTNLDTGESKVFKKTRTNLDMNHPNYYSSKEKLVYPTWLEMIECIDNIDSFTISSVEEMSYEFLESVVDALCCGNTTNPESPTYCKVGYYPNFYRSMVSLLNHTLKSKKYNDLKQCYLENLFLFKTLIYPKWEIKDKEYILDVLLSIDEFMMREHDEKLSPSEINDNGDINLAYTTYPYDESVEIQATFNINTMTLKVIYSDYNLENPDFNPDIEENVEMENGLFNVRYGKDLCVDETTYTIPEDLDCLLEMFNETLEFDHLISFDCEYEEMVEKIKNKNLGNQETKKDTE